MESDSEILISLSNRCIIGGAIGKKSAANTHLHLTAHDCGLLGIPSPDGWEFLVCSTSEHTRDSEIALFKKEKREKQMMKMATLATTKSIFRLFHTSSYALLRLLCSKVKKKRKEMNNMIMAATATSTSLPFQASSCSRVRSDRRSTTMCSKTSEH